MVIFPTTLTDNPVFKVTAFLIYEVEYLKNGAS